MEGMFDDQFVLKFSEYRKQKLDLTFLCILVDYGMLVKHLHKQYQLFLLGESILTSKLYDDDLGL